MSDDSGSAEPAVPPEETGYHESLIVDVSDMLLTQLIADVDSGSDSPLVVSLREILAEVDRSAAAISGWASYLDQPHGDPDD